MCKISSNTARGTLLALLTPVEPQGARNVSLVISKRASPMSEVAIYAILLKVAISLIIEEPSPEFSS